MLLLLGAANRRTRTAWNFKHTAADRDRYRVEPYVVAADVYAVPPHVGLGGWTWLTGSAGWMHRMILESLLGFQLRTDRLSLAPCVPPDWAGFTIRYRFRQTTYVIVAIPATDEDTKGRITQDGVVQETPYAVLVDDGGEHEIEVVY